ncbi:MAG: hypothetical protein ACR2GR_04565 [Rhodothermales bacterium]
MHQALQRLRGVLRLSSDRFDAGVEMEGAPARIGLAGERAALLPGRARGCGSAASGIPPFQSE